MIRTLNFVMECDDCVRTANGFISRLWPFIQSICAGGSGAPGKAVYVAATALSTVCSVCLTCHDMFAAAILHSTTLFVITHLLLCVEYCLSHFIYIFLLLFTAWPLTLSIPLATKMCVHMGKSFCKCTHIFMSCIILCVLKLYNWGPWSLQGLFLHNACLLLSSGQPQKLETQLACYQYWGSWAKKMQITAAWLNETH